MRQLGSEATAFCDTLWDPSAGLLRFSNYPPTGSTRPQHAVRESVWYAAGLLSRGRADDMDRAVSTLSTVLDNQILSPGQQFHGTFRRHNRENIPQTGARMWRDYDPNWREFIGVSLCLILARHKEAFSNSLVARISRAIGEAVGGSLERRVPVEYTNIYLLRIALLACASLIVGNKQWLIEAQRLMEDGCARIARHGTMHEFNSPTYYGVNLFALKMIQQFDESESMQAFAHMLESSLWHGVAQLYHAELQNLCGPFDRAYGMDMRAYVSLLGLWIALIDGVENAPLPSITNGTQHAHDFPFAACFAHFSPDVPDDVYEHFVKFKGPRLTRVPMGDGRVATAWLEGGFMVGAISRCPREWNQCCPVTAHWSLPSGQIGWLRARANPALSAEVDGRCLKIRNLHPRKDAVCTIDLYSFNTEQDMISDRKWTTLGLRAELHGSHRLVRVVNRTDLGGLKYHLPPKGNMVIQFEPSRLSRDRTEARPVREPVLADQSGDLPLCSEKD
jgi:hypothetical protein